MRRIQSLFLLIPALMFCVNSNINAQSSDESSGNSSSSALNISGLDGLGGFYFQDPSGLQIAVQGLSYEGSIDKATYLLGPNDLIAVQIETSQNILIRGLLINISGEVVIPSIGPVNINSLTVLEAEKKLEEVASLEYISPKVNISVEIPHPVNVHINGAIPAPGKYVLPAQSRVDLALLLATQPRLEADVVDVSAQSTREFLDNKSYSYRNITITHKD